MRFTPALFSKPQKSRCKSVFANGVPYVEGNIRSPSCQFGQTRASASTRLFCARSSFSVVEGWRGEIVYWLQSGLKGEINRCAIRDPSSVNWLGLEQAIHGNIVPDFPLCNKSFNQSYSGHDL